MNRRTRKGNKKIIIILSIVLVISVIMCAVIYFVKEKPQGNKKINEENVTENMSYLKIDTPYGVLHYPEKWEKELYYEKKEDSNLEISFYGKIEDKKPIQLFDIIFDGNEGDFLGYLDDTSVHILFHDLDVEKLDEEGQNTIIGMSESASVLINELEKMNNFSASCIPNIEGEIEIDTMYGVLYYPKKWEVYLEYEINEQNGNSIEFYVALKGKEKQHLFDLVFGEYEEEAIGKLSNGVNLYIHLYDLKDENKWSEEELIIYRGMQEDVNYIIDRLVKDGNLERML